MSQVFQNQYGILELLGVGDDLRRDRMKNVIDVSPQLVTVGLCYTFASAFLKASSCREVRLTELSDLLAFVVPELGCGRGYALALCITVFIDIEIF